MTTHPSTSPTAPEPPGPETPALAFFRALPIRRIEIDGTELTWREAGEGPPLLMIHGWPLNGATFRHHVALLRHRWTCIVPDLPGSGATPWAPHTANMLEDWGRLLAAFVRTLGLRDVSVIAHDSGGSMARVMAAEIEGDIRALALGNTEVSGHVSSLLRALQKGLRLPGADKVLRTSLGSRTFRRSAAGFGGAFGNLDLLDGDFHEACIAPLLEDARGARLAFVHCDLATTRRLPQIHARMSAPCLLIWGAEDSFFPLRKAKRMLGELPDGSRLEVVDGAKLFVHEEHPAIFAGLADTFLRSHLGEKSPQRDVRAGRGRPAGAAHA